MMVIKAQLKMDQLGRQRWTMAHEGNHFSGLLCISRGTWTIPFRSCHHQVPSLVTKPNNYMAEIVLRLITELYVTIRGFHMQVLG